MGHLLKDLQRKLPTPPPVLPLEIEPDPSLIYKLPFYEPQASPPSILTPLPLPKGNPFLFDLSQPMSYFPCVKEELCLKDRWLP